MRIDFEQYTVLLEKRLSLLRLLAGQFVDCREDFVLMKIDRMYSRIAEQEDLCRRIQALQPEIEFLQRVCARHLGVEPRELANYSEGAPWSERLHQVMTEMGEAQTQIARLNQIHSAYLRRSRKIVHVLMNSLGIGAVSYAPQLRSGAIPGHTSEEV